MESDLSRSRTRSSAFVCGSCCWAALLVETQDRLGESLGIDRLGEVVQSIGLEGLDRILIERCDKDHGWLGIDILQQWEKEEAVTLWHLDIEEYHIGPLLTDEGECPGDIARLSHDLYPGMSLETSGQMDSRERFVINQDGTKPWKCGLFGIFFHGFMIGSVTIARTRSGEWS